MQKLIEELKNTIQSNKEKVDAQIEKYAASSGRSSKDITLIGITKLHSAEIAAAGILSGIYNIGENRVQEAQDKIPAVNKLLEDNKYDTQNIKWHLVGPLQSNKANKSARLFDVIGALDSLKSAQKLSKTANDEGKKLEVFIEVNTSGEEQKAGIEPKDTYDFAAEIIKMDSLFVSGLMTVGPLTVDMDKVRASFALLRDLRDELSGKFEQKLFGGMLSMGMSGDFPIAIETGATHIRIGTALFGARKEL